MSFLNEEGLARVWNRVVARLNEKANKDHNHDDVYETKADAQTKLNNANTYTDIQVEDLATNFEEVIAGVYGYDPVIDESTSTFNTIRQIAHDEVIQNRTHGIDVIKGEAFIENTTFPLTDGGYEGAATLDIVAGDTLAIVYNGTEYTCKLQDASGLVGAPGALATGNLDLAMEVGDNGMPFVMIYVPSAYGNGVIIIDMYNPEATSCTVSIYKATEVVNKLPNKFIDAEWMATEITTKGDVVLEETTVTGELNQEIPIYVGYLTNSISDRLQLGEQYVVTVNGVEYICEYKSTNTPDMLPEEQECYLGNFAGIPSAFSSGEPFVLASALLVWKQSLGDTATISVHEAVKTVNKLPAKFLPDDISGNVDLTGYAKTEDIPTKTSELTNDSGFITAAAIPDSYTKTEVDSAISTAANTVKNDLLNGAGEAYDTLKELGTLIDENQDAIEALETVATGKADKDHSHDDRYYTETEVNNKLSEKSDANHRHNYYGVCSTASGVAAKTVDIAGFELVEGAMVIVKFTNSNSIGNPTLNVSGTGAKPMYRYGNAALSTSPTNTGWSDGAVQVFVYDGTGWIRDYWTNNTYSNSGFGHCYATCSTAADTAAKVVDVVGGYALSNGGTMAVKFTNAVCANATLNVNNKGDKAIYFRGAAITGDVIKAGDLATLMYNDSRYHLLSIDRWQEDIVDLKEYVDTVAAGKADKDHTHTEYMTSTNPVGTGSFSMNRKAGTTVGEYSHTEGVVTTASGRCSHAEGNTTIASGTSAHAEGSNTVASGNYSHAEGASTTASGHYSHAEGYYTIANGINSHAQGMFNIDNAVYAHTVGNGTAEDARSNAHTLDWDGNAWFAGDVYVGSTSGTNKDAGSVKLATVNDLTAITLAEIDEICAAGVTTASLSNEVMF